MKQLRSDVLNITARLDPGWWSPVTHSGRTLIVTCAGCHAGILNETNGMCRGGWVEETGRALYAHLRSQVHPLPASRELQRDADGRIVRALDAPADPSANRMASDGMGVVMRSVIERVFGKPK